MFNKGCLTLETTSTRNAFKFLACEDNIILINMDFKGEGNKNFLQ